MIGVLGGVKLVGLLSFGTIKSLSSHGGSFLSGSINFKGEEMNEQIQTKIFQIGKTAFQMMVEKEFYSSIVSAGIALIFLGLLLWGLKCLIAGLKKSDSYDKDGWIVAVGLCLLAMILNLSIISSQIFSAVYPEATILHDVFGQKRK